MYLRDALFRYRAFFFLELVDRRRRLYRFVELLGPTVRDYRLHLAAAVLKLLPPLLVLVQWHRLDALDRDLRYWVLG